MQIIAAVDRNGVIGKAGVLPWDVPSDRTRFRKMIAGKAIIMGRKTYESIGGILKCQRGYILSHTEIKCPMGYEWVPTIWHAIASAERQGFDLACIGGREAYALCLPLTTFIWFTVIECYTEDADDITYFPFAKLGDHWKTVYHASYALDDKDDHAYRILGMQRTKKERVLEVVK